MQAPRDLGLTPLPLSQVGQGALIFVCQKYISSTRLPRFLFFLQPFPFYAFVGPWTFVSRQQQQLSAQQPHATTLAQHVWRNGLHSHVERLGLYRDGRRGDGRADLQLG